MTDKIKIWRIFSDYKREGPDNIINCIKSLLILEKEKIEISVIKGTRILFPSQKENKIINNQVLEELFFNLKKTIIYH